MTAFAARPLPRSFYARDSRVVAPQLLNKLLVREGRVGRIVEVEAYCGAEDPASHAFRGRTGRNAAMFGPCGHLYVYFTYGMHHCCNVVCGEEGEGIAVLLRALEVEAGLEEMRASYPGAHRDRDLCRGPARLCKAFAIDRTFDAADLVTGDHQLVVADDGTPPPRPAVSTRIGVTAGADLPWRFTVPDAPGLSRRG